MAAAGDTGAGGGEVLDLQALVRGWRRDGVTAGGRHLTADYVGGLYTLNGYTFGGVANALAAGAS